MPDKFSNLTDNKGSVLQERLVDNLDQTVTKEVCASRRVALGRQTISVTTGSVSTLTVPEGARAAIIQADGAAVSLTLFASATPTASVGLRIDDGVMYFCDTNLADVKLIARTATTNVQVSYFDRP